MANAHCIAVDWGTTSFRAYLLNDKFELIDACRNQHGVMNITSSFSKVLQNACADWVEKYNIENIYLGGVIGSRNGWVETPYSYCPISVGEQKDKFTQLDNVLGCETRIFHGLQCTSPGGFPDVMRGEEIQVLGAMHCLEGKPAVLCLPGTHSKWVSVNNNTIHNFASMMTGEIFALMLMHSSIGSLIDSHEFDQASFLNGLQDYRESNVASGCNFLHSMFSVRSRVVSNSLKVDSLYSYLSGMLIADEINSAQSMFDLSQGVHLVSGDKLQQPYLLALETMGIEVQDYASETAFISGVQSLLS
ncbi:MAG: 2-dehydro-3-deoxygalactonokinase [Gammaproteobacteria bacterium]|nr:2-dehydro-3-deoxygalactonokinase [Gammaproteobacteria bacterium]NNM14972.1 2-dehydro-3-deoxygalactonokinase [Gammaproteobacteria bacterium]